MRKDFKQILEEARLAKHSQVRVPEERFIPRPSKNNRIEAALAESQSLREQALSTKHQVPNNFQYQSPKPQTRRKARIRWGRLFIILIITFAIIAGISYGGWNIYKYFTGEERSAKMLVEEVGKLIDLPEDEEPTIMTVADTEALKDHAFFAEAKLGDKVLIYGVSKKAILYRPDEKKIIAIAPLK